MIKHSYLLNKRREWSKVGDKLNITEYEIRKKYRYSSLSYVFDVYMECEYRANLTQEEYEGLFLGEFRFDYESWSIRLDISKKQMERAIKELVANDVITQTFKGKKGTQSKYFLNRLEEKKKEKKRRRKGEEKSIENTRFGDSQGEEKEIEKEKKKEQSSQYNNLNISNNIYSSNDYEEIWKTYPNKKGKAKAMTYIEKILKTISKEELLRCIERYSNDVEEQRAKGFKTLSYKNGSTFFNGGYVDYLDENYGEEKPKEDIQYIEPLTLEELLGERV